MNAVPGPVGKLVQGSDGVETMRTVLYEGSRQVEVDTDHDDCLYAAPRPSKISSEFQRQGKDLYIHTDHEENITYYVHMWEMNSALKDKAIPVSPSNAERFLRSKGLICDLFPKNDPITTLYQWGYGIAEEF